MTEDGSLWQKRRRRRRSAKRMPWLSIIAGICIAAALLGFVVLIWEATGPG